MKTKSYIVRVQEVHTIEVPVEATSLEKAIAKAKESIYSGYVDYKDMEYSHTLDSNEWTVRDAETHEVYQ